MTLTTLPSIGGSRTTFNVANAGSSTRAVTSGRYTTTATRGTFRTVSSRADLRQFVGGSTAVRQPQQSATKLTFVAFQLRHPLAVTLEQGTDEVVVTHEPTGTYGAGDDLPSALVDLLDALREHLEILEREHRERRLGVGLEAQRALLRDLLTHWHKE